eukprot:14094056-Ditylum_brightwellii.AAC.1
MNHDQHQPHMANSNHNGQQHYAQQPATVSSEILQQNMASSEPQTMSPGLSPAQPPSPVQQFVPTPTAGSGVDARTKAN